MPEVGLQFYEVQSEYRRKWLANAWASHWAQCERLGRQGIAGSDSWTDRQLQRRMADWVTEDHLQRRNQIDREVEEAAELIETEDLLYKVREQASDQQT